MQWLGEGSIGLLNLAMQRKERLSCQAGVRAMRRGARGVASRHCFVADRDPIDCRIRDFRVRRFLARDSIQDQNVCLRPCPCQCIWFRVDNEGKEKANIYGIYATKVGLNHD